MTFWLFTLAMASDVPFPSSTVSVASMREPTPVAAKDERPPLSDVQRRKKEKQILLGSGAGMAAVGLTTTLVTLATTQGSPSDFDAALRQERRSSFGVGFGVPLVMGGGVLSGVGLALRK
jgi:hypothetical protein